MINEEKKLIEAGDLSLDDWLKMVVTPKDERDFELYPDYFFPTNHHRTEYLNSISSRSRSDIKSLLRVFLLPTCNLGGDLERIKSFIKQDINKALEIEQVRRVIRGDSAWEGVTWVLDLLHRPQLAINVLNAYLAAHFWWMPDWRISGIFDAMAVIRAAFLEIAHPRDEMLRVQSRDFEFIIGLLFHRLEYEVIVTKRSQDGGVDIVLKKSTAGNVENSLVECKRHVKNVGVKEVRSLLGVVERDGATRGLLVTTSSFTKNAISESSKTNRMELIDFDKLCILFNEHFGPDWTSRIDSIVFQARRKFEIDNSS